jgi:hypothetical protein
VRRDAGEYVQLLLRLLPERGGEVAINRTQRLEDAARRRGWHQRVAQAEAPDGDDGARALAQVEGRVEDALVVEEVVKVRGDDP